jgi:signal transduction histidine kinase
MAGDLRPGIGDRVQLQQVVMNLILNGIEAMRDTEGRARRLVVRSEMRKPDEVPIAVQDEGVGIDSKNQRRIFDPFFMTKPQGMGLNISHTIVEAHCGRLWASAKSDCGTTFQFTLPAAIDRV